MVAQVHEQAEFILLDKHGLQVTVRDVWWGVAKISGLYRGTEGFSPSQPTKAESGPFQAPWGFFSPSRTHVVDGVLLAKLHHLPVYLPKEHLFKYFPKWAPELTLLPRFIHFFIKFPTFLWPFLLAETHLCAQPPAGARNTENLHPFGFVMEFVFFPQEARSGFELVGWQVGFPVSPFK